MTATILGIVATVLGFALWAIKRAITNADDPATIRRKQKEQADALLAKRDVAGVNLHLDDLLRRVQDAGSHPSGQGGPAAESGGNPNSTDGPVAGPSGTNAGDPPRSI